MTSSTNYKGPISSDIYLSGYLSKYIRYILLGLNPQIFLENLNPV